VRSYGVYYPDRILLTGGRWVILGVNDMFCVKCGTEKGLIDNLCGGCYGEVTEIMRASPVMDITVCRGCDSFLHKKQWKYFENIDDLIDREILVILAVDSNVDIVNIDLVHRVEDDHRRNLFIELKGTVAGTEVEDDASIIVNLKKGVCDRCSKIAGKYYESILQIRGEDHKLSEKKLETILTFVMKEMGRLGKKDRGSFISRHFDMHSGMDFYLGKISDGKNLAKVLGSRYGSRIKESSTLAGRKDGKDYYRVTFLVRIPPYGAGDYIIFKKKPWKLEKLTPKKALLTDLPAGDKLTVDRKELRGVTVLGSKEIIRKAVIVSRKIDTGELIVLHPETYRSVDAIVPASTEISPEDEEVNVIVHDDDVYIV